MAAALSLLYYHTGFCFWDRIKYYVAPVYSQAPSFVHKYNTSMGGVVLVVYIITYSCRKFYRTVPSFFVSTSP